MSSCMKATKAKNVGMVAYDLKNGSEHDPELER